MYKIKLLEKKRFLSDAKRYSCSLSWIWTYIVSSFFGLFAESTFVPFLKPFCLFLNPVLNEFGYMLSFRFLLLIVIFMLIFT